MSRGQQGLIPGIERLSLHEAPHPELPQHQHVRELNTKRDSKNNIFVLPYELKITFEYRVRLHFRFRGPLANY